jgi:hypothetical protein
MDPVQKAVSSKSRYVRAQLTKSLNESQVQSACPIFKSLRTVVMSWWMDHEMETCYLDCGSSALACQMD